MPEPTPEQRAILESDARVRLVLAAPGSGKTWLVGQAIRRELERSPKAGIAALSFTNVAGEEIRAAVGHELAHPHFVGTLDAFAYRYVVRPFAHLLPIDPPLSPIRLLPEEACPQGWRTVEVGGVPLTVSLGRTRRGGEDTCHLFDAVFLSYKDRKPVLGRRQQWSGLRLLSEHQNDKVFNAKQRLWRKLGWASYSDVTFLAAMILGHEGLGPLVRRTLAERFNFLVVDELQDTGWYLGESVYQLAQSGRALLVGDPDQAIYEFNGAKPDLTDRFKGLKAVEALPLRKSLRCARRISQVAQHLAQSGAEVHPRDDEEGQVLMLTYEDPKVDLNQLWDILASRGSQERVQVVVRGNKAAQEVVKRTCLGLGSTGSPVINHLHRAVVQFRLGDNFGAKAATNAAMAKAIFNDDSIQDEQLDARQIDTTSWRLALTRLLLVANGEVAGESLLEWSERMRPEIKRLAEAVTSDAINMIRSPKRKVTEGTPRAEYLPPAVDETVLAQLKIGTVHAAKGETHDVTVFYCPPPTKRRPCPSSAWWSKDPVDAEEGRIAFVAATRARDCFILVVHESTADRFFESQSDFARCFDRNTVAEYVAAIGSTS